MNFVSLTVPTPPPLSLATVHSGTLTPDLDISHTPCTASNTLLMPKMTRLTFRSRKHRRVDSGVNIDELSDDTTAQEPLSTDEQHDMTIKNRFVDSMYLYVSPSSTLIFDSVSGSLSYVQSDTVRAKNHSTRVKHLLPWVSHNYII